MTKSHVRSVTAQDATTVATTAAIPTTTAIAPTDACGCYCCCGCWRWRCDTTSSKATPTYVLSEATYLPSTIDSVPTDATVVAAAGAGGAILLAVRQHLPMYLSPLPVYAALLILILLMPTDAVVATTTMVGLGVGGGGVGVGWGGVKVGR